MGDLITRVFTGKVQMTYALQIDGDEDIDFDPLEYLLSLNDE